MSSDRSVSEVGLTGRGSPGVETSLGERNEWWWGVQGRECLGGGHESDPGHGRVDEASWVATGTGVVCNS